MERDSDDDKAWAADAKPPAASKPKGTESDEEDAAQQYDESVCASNVNSRRLHINGLSFFFARCVVLSLCRSLSSPIWWRRSRQRWTRGAVRAAS